MMWITHDFFPCATLRFIWVKHMLKVSSLKRWSTWGAKEVIYHQSNAFAVKNLTICWKISSTKISFTTRCFNTGAPEFLYLYAVKSETKSIMTRIFFFKLINHHFFFAVRVNYDWNSFISHIGRATTLQWNRKKTHWTLRIHENWTAVYLADFGSTKYEGKWTDFSQ